MQTDFKNIKVVPIGNEFVDLTFSRVHRQPPNITKPNRTREVKKANLCFRHKLSTILHDFPRLHEIHPLYTDLLRSVLHRDRYKLALAQVDTARHLISEIADDYAKQCRSLQKASAVGGMYSVVNEITPSLAYLEQLRQHMVRLPSLDPSSPTLLVSGFPNADKTCFMNRISTTEGGGGFRTESVFFAVGHTDYKDLRFQVIDAPGILDKPVRGDCDVITALATHLRAALVLFFLDVSGSCGYSIAHQAAFFHSLKCLFVDRPLLVVCNETDSMQISEQDWKLIEEMYSGTGASEEVGLEITNLGSEGGLMSVKKAACERLLDQRERLSFVDQEEAKILRNKYISSHQEWKDGITSLQNLDDDHKVSDLLVDSDVLFRLEELEREKGHTQVEDEEDDFVMSKTEEHKDQRVAIRKIQPLRMLIALAFFVLVGNTYGTIQQCLSTLSF